MAGDIENSLPAIRIMFGTGSSNWLSLCLNNMREFGKFIGAGVFGRPVYLEYGVVWN